MAANSLLCVTVKSPSKNLPFPSNVQPHQSPTPNCSTLKLVHSEPVRSFFGLHFFLRVGIRKTSPRILIRLLGNTLPLHLVVLLVTVTLNPRERARKAMSSVNPSKDEQISKNVAPAYPSESINPARSSMRFFLELIR